MKLIKLKKIWLVRHGETEFNINCKIQGHLDSPLTPDGLEQLANLADYLSGHKIDMIFSSDLLRARLTAQSIAAKHNGVQIQYLQELRERCFGEFEGWNFFKYKAVIGENLHRVDFAPTGGESLLDVQARGRKVLEIINKSEAENCLVVAHGTFNRCFLGAASSAPHQEWINYKQGNCCFNELAQTEDSGFRINILNELTFHGSGHRQ